MNNKKSLQDKLSNLISITVSDSAIFAKLDSKHISISKNIDSLQIDGFFNNEFETIELKINLNADLLKTQLRNTNSGEEFLKIIDDNEIQISKIKRNLLLNKFDENKAPIIEFVTNYIRNIKNKFLLLNSTANNIQRDKGSWNLYLAKYFLKGITPNKKSAINAPILLFPIKIKEQNGTIYIVKDSENFVVNEKLIVFLQRDIEKQIKTITEYKNLSSLNELKNAFEEILELKEIETVFTNENKFLNELKDDVSSKFDELVINDELCLGIFEPRGGKLSEELDELIKKDDYQSIFGKDPTISFEQIERDEIEDEPILQVDKLDIYQRYAVRAALHGDTIIHGPPGTGKSEVITNIIANILYRNQTILMISEKVAALNVLIKRLKSLNMFAISIHDANDKHAFYNKICELATFLNNSWLLPNADFMVADEELNHLNDCLEKVKDYKFKIKDLEDFENFKIYDTDFKGLAKEIKSIGDFSYLQNFIDEKIEEKISENLKNSNWDSLEEYFLKLNKFYDFIKNNKLVNLTILESFIYDAKKLNDILTKYNLVLTNDLIEDCKRNQSFLSDLITNNRNYYQILKDDPELFYRDIKLFVEAEEKLFGIINGDFFSDLKTSSKKLKSFLNVFSLAKENDKKFILDNFLKSLSFDNKKSFADKIFGKRKLSSSDNLILKLLENINKLNLEKYVDFNFIKDNKECFKPLNILYFFNNRIFDEKYNEFNNQEFYKINIDLFLWITKNNVNSEKYKNSIRLAKMYTEFKNAYPQFVSNSLFNDVIKGFKETKWDMVSNLIANIVRVNILNKLSRLSKDDKDLVKDAFRVANSTRRRSIYSYLERYNRVLQHVFPIWITRPEQCAIYLPFEKYLFDYGIFDEVSQMFLERAYPLLYRSKINIVAGDDKQLKPSNFFSSRNSEDDEYDLEDLDVQESLLDRAKATTWVEVILKNHYRSQSRSLIEFSSKFIYDDKLNYATLNGNVNQVALEVKNVNGYFENRINVQEANEVLYQLENNHDKYNSILVITFNATQQDYIQNMLYSKNFNNPEIIKKVNEGKINIINIENVQGDEAELVILSICYGRKKGEDKVKATFGAIIQSGGKNRLNVAITRAKSKMIVIKSLSAGQVNDSPNDNLMIFKKFLAFADNIEIEIKKSLQADKLFNKDLQHFDSSFEEDVYDSIKNEILDMNLKLQTQYEVGNKKIDIVVLNQDESKVLLGIEVDGWKYHSGTKKKIEDYERQQFLEARGYKIFRVLEHEYNYNKELVLKCLFIELNESINQNKKITTNSMQDY